MPRLLLIAMSIFLLIAAAAQESPAREYGENLVTVAPIAIYGSPVNDTGLGLGYERFINPSFSLTSFYMAGLAQGLHQGSMGVRMYFKGHSRKMSYALSPQFIYSYFDYTDGSGDYIGFPPDPVIIKHRQFGFILLHSLNVTLDSRFYVGFEAGFGVNYVDEVIRSDAREVEVQAELNRAFHMRLGYRF